MDPVRDLSRRAKGAGWVHLRASSSPGPRPPCEEDPVARPPKHPVDVKLKIVLSVLSGESTQAEAARRHGVSETSIGKWKDQFLQGGRTGLEHGSASVKPDRPGGQA
jgi:hypothetical protein